MSKEFYKSDGSRIVVTDNGLVYDSNGLKGQINTFGDYVSANGSESYTIYENGSFVGSNGNSGNITNGNYIQMNNTNSANTGSSLRAPSTVIRIPLWFKLILVFVIIPILGGASMLIMISFAIFNTVYEELQSGNVVPIIVFFVIIIALIALLAYFMYKVVGLIKKKIK